MYTGELMERRVSEYLNYREFLKDFFQSKKNHNPNFSYKLFGTKAGFQQEHHGYGHFRQAKSGN
jgi:hypothetical protein